MNGGPTEQHRINTGPSRTTAIRPHHSNILALFRAFDSFMVVLLLWGILGLLQTPWDNTYTWLSVLAIISFSFLAEINGVYDVWRGYSTPALASRLLMAWTGTAVITGTAILLLEVFRDSNALALTLWLVCTPLIIVTCHWLRRLLLAILRRQPAQPRRVGIVGATPLGYRLSRAINDMPWMGYRIHGYYDDRLNTSGSARRLSGKEIEIRGNLEQLQADAHDGKLDIIFITLPMAAEQRIRGLMGKLADSTVSAYLIPDVFTFDLLHSRLTAIQGIPAVSIYDSPLVEHGWTKRACDLVLSLGILAVLALPMLAVAIGVKLSSPGPVLFKQTRYGIHGERIKVWKFRSMSVCEDGGTINQASRNDPRVTRFGAFIRRTSLDELPQLFNVLGGSMSLIGPRPHAVAHNEFYREHIQGYMLRHKVKPGITGLAQVNGFRGETETMDKMAGRIAYDLEYIRNWSLWLDIRILWWTIFRGFVGQHAY
ncbi:MAG: undecaprenyl-phosphate glucose phosphotransferase [Ectothiorhodospiraceae bacterium]|nr:undecaprenyl-phosphate glucose phosphotransferase [Ectothiorhodospiraceae bacterium]MCH8504041.1 undecaprenyl-phosphate glucose phosphotransferase [Ectothiorhodospiraceae bacterium]